MSTATLPPPAEIRERIKLTREELSQLKRLLRASESAEKADAARSARGGGQFSEQGGAGK